jgi:hypothetical protein
MKKLPTPVKQELLALAQTLPKIMYKNIDVQVSLKGSQLINGGINKTKDGSIIKPTNNYVSPAGKKEVNHYKQMKKLWLKASDENQAWQFVKAYCSQITHKHKTQQDA